MSSSKTTCLPRTMTVGPQCVFGLLEPRNELVLISQTQLDRTIDRIGMGSYQWTLLSLCGFGEYTKFMTSSTAFLTSFCRVDGRQCAFE